MPDKVSYRFKTRKNGALSGMKAFSIHHPAARNYLSEQLVGLLVKDLGLIAPKYEFINFKLNDTDYGVYALEEYPSKYMLGRNSDVKVQYIVLMKLTIFPIDAIVNVKNISNKGVESNLTEVGGTIFSSFRQGLLSVDEAFDPELLGRFFAALSLIESEHALVAKSFRVYFNPLSLKLEPIIFDAHSQNRFVVGLTSSLGKGFSQDWTNSGSADWFSLFWNTSGNERFIKSYIQTLKLISNKEWVDDFLSRNSAIINDSLATIYSDFPERDYVWNYGPAPYYWNDSFIYRQASWIQKQFQIEILSMMLMKKTISI